MRTLLSPRKRRCWKGLLPWMTEPVEENNQCWASWRATTKGNFIWSTQPAEFQISCSFTLIFNKLIACLSQLIGVLYSSVFALKHSGSILQLIVIANDITKEKPRCLERIYSVWRSVSYRSKAWRILETNFKDVQTTHRRSRKHQEGSGWGQGGREKREDRQLGL